jgi:hypothetical protein
MPPRTWNAFVLVVLTGCGPDDSGSGGRTSEAPAPRAAAVSSAADRKPETVREKAAIGMGEKGRGYGGDMITEPVKAYWNARERLVLDQIQHAMNLYKASEGSAPKSHQEFMDRIVKENHLQLPTLPTGHRYVYDPSKEELQVERPKEP